MRIDLARVLGQTTQPGLPKAELLFDHPEWVFDPGADVGLGGAVTVRKDDAFATD